MSLGGFGALNLCSRAFWDDCDEDNIGDEDSDESSEDSIGDKDSDETKKSPRDNKKLELEFDSGSSLPLSPDVLFVLEGVDIAPFATAVLTAKKRICKIPPHTSTSALYVDPKRRMVIAVITEDLKTSGEVCELLKRMTEGAGKVITLSIRPKVEYKTERIAEVRNKMVVLRGLNSGAKDDQSLLPDVELLEAPNFMVGVAAGIATHRCMRGQTVGAYVAYLDRQPLDAQTAQPIIELMKAIGVDCAPSYRPKPVELSNIYI